MQNRRPILLIFLLSISITFCYSQSHFERDIYNTLDSLLSDNKVRPFNGVILIARQDSIKYFRSFGYSDYSLKESMTLDKQFVIGSLSKQVTAVLVLQHYEQGKLNLDAPINDFLPEMEMSWKSTVTIHHLLSHTHGITNRKEPLNFRPGTSFSYSDLGYAILGDILERVTGKTYLELVDELFLAQGMMHSTSRKKQSQNNLPVAYYRDFQGNLQIEKETFDNLYTPAAGLISNANDLLLWNQIFHNQIIISSNNYNLMVSPYAAQNHSLFGTIGYGYGIRISDENNILEIGHTGYVPGYISVNLYYPESKTSLIMLENLDWKDQNIKKTFYHELIVRSLLRNYKPNKK